MVIEGRSISPDIMICLSSGIVIRKISINSSASLLPGLSSTCTRQFHMPVCTAPNVNLQYAFGIINLQEEIEINKCASSKSFNPQAKYSIQLL